MGGVSPSLAMGAKIIVPEKTWRDIKMSDGELSRLLMQRMSDNLNAQMIVEGSDKNLLKKLSDYRDDWKNLSRGDDLRQYLAVPKAVDTAARRVLGEDYYKVKSKEFSKFLDMKWGSVKGEVFLTVPRDKL